MQINCNVKLLDAEGEEMSEPVFSNTPDPVTGNRKLKRMESITFGWAASQVLLNLSQDESKLSGVEKNDRANLAMRIKVSQGAESPIDMTLEEAALLKKLTGEKLTPILVHRVWALLES